MLERVAQRPIALIGPLRERSAFHLAQLLAILIILDGAHADLRERRFADHAPSGGEGK